ncbi:MAG: DNA polymerase III subunit gamma/tau [Deltaproteobacteria bacterium]|nr:DNA polymerase III subunit gamma/tau [Deltaproteobacteria bacterium]MBW1919189.1 DNA polymerase III subunit gamma/tau [Deltaproteobacteria bacterium]RLB34563.1 MAG: DNA polymerase III subunit gamma/tau [Deltaproteobacteria bacterium]
MSLAQGWIFSFDSLLVRNQKHAFSKGLEKNERGITVAIMAYEVLARKWRPQLFSDVVGQEHVTQTLMNAIKAGRLAHAYLFSGARGVGKTSVARILAKAINCVQGEPGIPCNKCHSCIEIMNGSSVDVQEIDGASNRGIDEIRELRENIKFMPSSSKYRVYIIDEVHMLTLPAFNALLKTLEEPPAHVKFIFATTEPHKVPATILSRCQRFDFRRIPFAQIVEQIKKISAEEDLKISDAGIALIARHAEGSMRDAESLLDQVVSYTGPNVEDKQIAEILGIVDRDIIFEASLAILEGSSKRCLDIVEKIYEYGYDIREFYRALMDQFRNLLVSQVGSIEDLPDILDSEKEELRKQAKMAGTQKLQQALNVLIAKEQNLRLTSHPRLILETIMIKLCQIGEVLSFDDLLSKIEALERRLLSSHTVHPETRGGQLSEPAPTWEAEKRTAKGPERGSAPLEKEDWEGFLKHLSAKNHAMANVLKEWSFVSGAGDTLEIKKGGNSFSASYLDEPDRYERLAAYCREFFNRDLKIKLLEGEKISNKKRSTGSTSKAEDVDSGKRGQSNLPKSVRNVVEAFQGEIITDKQ